MLNREQVEEILLNIGTKRAELDVVELDGALYYLSEKEDEGWESDGKFEANYYIYELMRNDGDEIKPTGIFVGQGRIRTGSYYSEYYYEYESFDIFEQIEVTVKKWVVKKD